MSTETNGDRANDNETKAVLDDRPHETIPLSFSVKTQRDPLPPLIV